MTRVFVNYRVSDEPYGAALIDRALVARFGSDSVFRDSRSIQSGEDFEPAIREALLTCGALIAVIGPTWLTATDSTGQRRLDSTDDWVRWEIAEALRLGLPVIPVMLGGAEAVDEGDLPADIAALARHQFVRVDHATVERDLTWLIDRLAKLIPNLGMPPLFRPPLILAPDFLPSALLRAEYGVVPFAGRDADFAELRAWCAENTRFSARLVTGPAGQGKTRIADELCGDLRPEWVAGFVSEHADVSAAAVLPGRVLLVIDYAEGRIDQLHDLTEAVMHGPAERVRLLLVARSAGHWRAALCGHESDEISTVFRTMVEQWLPPLATQVRDRHAEFARAVVFLAKALDHDGQGVLPPADLVDDRYDRALDIHAAALAALLDNAAAESDWHDPIARVLDHERRYWNRTTATYDLPDPHHDRLSAVTAAATLFTARDRPGAQAVLMALPTFADQPGDVVGRYVRWVSRLYPGPLTLNALQPDRLGEDHVAATLVEQPEIAVSFATHSTDEQLTQAITVLGRAAPRHPHLTDTLAELLTVDPDRCVRAGIQVASKLEDPRSLVHVLTQAVTEDSRLDQLNAVLTSLPPMSVALVDLAERSSRLALDAHRQLPDRDPVVTVRLLHIRSHHLANIGEYNAALAAIEEAVEQSQPLVTEHRDAFLPYLAELLIQQTHRLGSIGRWGTALDVIENAVALIRELAADHHVGFLQQLSDVLSIHSGVLVRLDRWLDAQPLSRESVAILRDLAENYPGVFRERLAISLAGLSAALRGPDDHEEAVATQTEAVAILRRLAAERPDVHRPTLANFLGGLTGRLEKSGRYAEALSPGREAVEHLRELATDNPGTYSTDLAVVLHRLSLCHWGLGNRDDSFEAAEESIAAYRIWATEYPDAGRPALAAALRDISDRLSGAGRNADALRAAEECVRIYRELATERGHAFAFRFMGALAALASIWARSDTPDNAMTPIREAIEICREQISADEGSSFVAMLIMNWIAKTMHTIGRRDAAIALLNEALSASDGEDEPTDVIMETLREISGD